MLLRIVEHKKKILIAVILIALALNAYIFSLGYTAASNPVLEEYANDFSAYYIGAWRLFHNPTQIYASGHYLPGDYLIEPTPQIFKYTPSFLVFFSPLLALSYQDALNLFDIIQFLSICVLAFFVYQLVKDKNLLLGSITAIIILLAPTGLSLDAKIIFQGYYWGYTMANAHIIQTPLIVGAIYFAYTKKPWICAFLVATASFDPRVVLLALPLLIWYSRQTLQKTLLATIGFIAAFNGPFFFYQNIGLTFLQEEVKGTIITQMYAYDWVPLLAVTILTLIEAIPIITLKKDLIKSVFGQNKT
jgi:multisubunit Na+/H+ antiporter MnhC subunit